jgi:site-specific DNA recombinase
MSSSGERSSGCSKSRRWCQPKLIAVLAEARAADPLRPGEQSLRHQQLRLHNAIERLLTAYQEELLSLEQLRQRMPALRKQRQSVDAELQSLALATADQSRYLRLTETLADFSTKLHARADALDVTESRKSRDCLYEKSLLAETLSSFGTRFRF